MNQIDALILANVVRHLERAAEYIKEGGFKAEMLAGLDVTWAITDIKSVLQSEEVTQ